ncbi:MAG: RtcB family protein, partial [Chryseobacterium sp.]
MKHNITGKDLLEIGFSEGKILGLALTILKDNFVAVEEIELLALFKKVKDYPESFLDDEVLSILASALVEDAKPKIKETTDLIERAKAYEVFGADGIEEGARKQMDIAMQLPISVAGALMPDAHQGYGLPIGGVLATRNAIIPYGVGVDIGCRMALSIFDIPEKHYFGKDALFKRELIAHTKFGAGQNFKGNERANHEVLENKAFYDTPLLKSLHGKAWAQLGTSGGGNHFVEWGIIDFAERDDVLNIDKGRYVALLTHSGSRGFGATIAGHYTKLAKEICKLPKEAANLAYLDLNSAEGQEYWLSMNLAGDYASACHEVIHQR